ncbi:CopG family ribbon-helix-helix protein [Candidatus Fukatsuia symbiotica]|uniref:CopG family transcriptional regulator n=1 Tax=Candidatus Fukatsuia symbiotica TaxID=1878942 RepID=A0A2U8I9D6_9GAMM|nr:CopG family ribbon-helix-helix protein [Candidatus Fukatsuia symbiotica]AWK15727.1 CopG family transcriptional regulator [Candidatus Fukatsuia symbiotica]MEA9446091.1 CopG family ribbon-helix-helix protein [Candidatus Fukatsuia symbiotica]
MATSIKLDDHLKTRIHHLAERQRRSAHWIMREAIRDYVDREEKRENFKQEALGSWAIYQKTGRHLSGDEVRGWLQTWGTDKETEIPPCHK